MRVQILSNSELEVLLSYLEKCTIRDNLVIRLMLQCGLRIGEVSNLNIEHVWRGGHVHPAINLVQGTTKGHQARYVDIPQPVKILLSTYIEGLISKNTNCHIENPLFSGLKRRSRLRVSGIGRIVKRISLASLGRAVHPHLLRHTYATILLRHTNIRVVQLLLGHARLESTQIYTHPTSEECKTAVNEAFNR